MNKHPAVLRVIDFLLKGDGQIEGGFFLLKFKVGPSLIEGLALKVGPFLHSRSDTYTVYLFKN